VRHRGRGTEPWPSSFGIYDRDSVARIEAFVRRPKMSAITPTPLEPEWQLPATPSHRTYCASGRLLLCVATRGRKRPSRSGAATNDKVEVWGGPPCIRCTTHLIQAGIRPVVSYPAKTPSTWAAELKGPRLGQDLARFRAPDATVVLDRRGRMAPRSQPRD
jgi:hypothetical protein